MKYLVLMLLLCQVAMAQTTERFRNIEPNATDSYNNGSSVRRWLNTTTQTITAANSSFTGPMLNGYTAANITAGTPLTLNMATCAPVLAITNITSGNVILNMVNVTANQRLTIIEVSGKLGSTGNLTVNITGGTVNGFDNVTITNSSAISSGNPFDAFHFIATSNSTGFLAR